jgi:membrane protease YdiL (CAAX protease family)
VGPRKQWAELWLVLMLSLGASAIYSIISLVRKLLSEQGLAGSSTTLNRPLAEQPWLDLISQLVSISLSLVPVLLALYFLYLDGTRLELWPRAKDFLWGLGLPLLVGFPGIALYVFAVQWGLTAKVIPSSLGDYWWTPLILLLAALRAGLLEEVIAVGFLIRKLQAIRPGISVLALVLISSLFRASYHLYQGFSAFIGNFVMGVIFSLIFIKKGRIAPLVIAHTAMDAAVFIGYPLVAPLLPI